MYTARKVKGVWWVGFLYSDGRFDRIADFRSRIEAVNAALRMNRA